MARCYYHGDSCDYSSGLWECETCGESYCHAHSHSTELGKNVECVACEGIREDEEYDDYEEEKTLQLTTFYLLQSDKKYDFSLQGGTHTHIEIHFAEYEDRKGQPWPTDMVAECIVSVKDLFDALKLELGSTPRGDGS